jgi:hypothetical protein
MISAWRRFRDLSSHEQSAVLQAAFWLAATWIGLRVAGFRRWKNTLSRLAPSVPAASVDANSAEILAQARAMARWHAAAARHLFIRTNCLEQAMVLWFMLRRHGVAAEMRFGARKEAARLEAHAWVECVNVALNEEQGKHLHFLPFEGAAMMESLPD